MTDISDTSSATATTDKQNCKIDTSKPSLIPDEQAPLRPVTWSYRDLFELYIFADFYDTLALRQQVLSIIQIKLMMEKPRMYEWPSIADIAYAAQNLPSTSGLRKFLVGLVSKDFTISGLGRNRISAAENLGELPGDFLAECLVSAKAERSSGACDNSKCIIHTKGDRDNVLHGDLHIFHEHENDSKQAEELCCMTWDLLLEKFCRHYRDIHEDYGSNDGSD